jgi:DMSO/TMAO reductase YedYZ molybdopterin-dependent catalytic subunit
MRGTLAAAAGLSGCDRLTSSMGDSGILNSAESLNRTLSRALFGQRLAPEYPASAISAHFRSNGTTEPDSESYHRMAESQFTDYRLEIGGLVENPLRLSLAELRSALSRTQITRHDCVEGWSCIGK